MTEWLKNQKALVQPGNADLPYSDPVTAAPAAVINRVRESLRIVSEMLDTIEGDLGNADLPDTDWHVGFAMMAVRDALQSLAADPGDRTP